MHVVHVHAPSEHCQREQRLRSFHALGVVAGEGVVASSMKVTATTLFCGELIRVSPDMLQGPHDGPA